MSLITTIAVAALSGESHGQGIAPQNSSVASAVLTVTAVKSTPTATRSRAYGAAEACPEFALENITEKSREVVEIGESNSKRKYKRNQMHFRSAIFDVYSPD